MMMLSHHNLPKPLSHSYVCVDLQSALKSMLIPELWVYGSLYAGKSDRH